MSWDESQYVIKKLEDYISTQDKKLAPKAMTACSATGNLNRVDLTWTLPTDTVIDNNTLCEVEGVMIRKKIGEPPASIKDGTLVTISTQSPGTYIDTDVVPDTTYYYRFFPYSTEGAYSKNTNNIKTATPEQVVIYGFHDDFSDLNPDTRITYPNDVANAGYSPMMTNASAGTPTAGSWQTFLTDVLENKPAMVKLNGELDYWLDPDDYTKKLDGTASDVSNTSYSGAGAFAWISRIYMKEVYDQDGNGRTVYFCKNPKIMQVDNDFYPVGFVDGDDNVLEGQWIPMFYKNCQNPKTLGGITYFNYSDIYKGKMFARQHTYDSTYGIKDIDRARLFGGPLVNVIRDLELMLYKSTDLLDKAGWNMSYKSGYDSYMIDKDTPQNTQYQNQIVGNDSVRGFKGNGQNDIGVGKIFHSMLLGTHQAVYGFYDPYMVYSNRNDLSYYGLHVGTKYIKLTSGGDEIIGKSGVIKTTNSSYSVNYANRSNYPYPSKMEHIDKTFGSLIDVGDNSGSADTGYCYRTFAGEEYNNNVTGRIMCRSAKTHKGDICGVHAATWSGSRSRQYLAGVLMLPPANYNPNS